MVRVGSIKDDGDEMSDVIALSHCKIFFFSQIRSKQVNGSVQTGRVRPNMLMS